MTFQIKKWQLKKHKLTAGWYDRYLQSPEWHAVRDRILKLRENKCENCNTDKHIIIHHLTYERVTKEKDEDLKALCGECHYKAHYKKLIPYNEVIYDEWYIEWPPVI